MEMSKVNILLIEDNEADVHRLNELLNAAREGKYEITTTVTLKGGLAQLADNKFDVVITELNLPDADGINTITDIQEQDKSVPIVVLSVQDSEETGFASSTARCSGLFSERAGRWSSDLSGN